MKHWTKSKTIWFNALSALLAIMAMPEVLEVIPADYLPHVMVATALGNFFLRAVTDKGVRL